MAKKTCNQRGCEYEDDSNLTHCPICNNPIIPDEAVDASGSVENSATSDSSPEEAADSEGEVAEDPQNKKFLGIF